MLFEHFISIAPVQTDHFKDLLSNEVHQFKGISC